MIINGKELHMALRDLENVRDILERNKQTGSVYRVDKTIKHLSKVLELLDSCELSGTDVEKALKDKGIDL